ncbi:MAG: hypothetical protein U0992_03630 [Planctomycetaceae bacterium]
MTSFVRLVVIVGMLLGVRTGLTRADAPLASYVFPAGGPRGAVVAVNLGGCNLNQECSWEFDGPGIEANARLIRVPHTTWIEGPVLSHSDSQAKEDYPKDYAGRVVIANDAPLGVHHWRVWTSQGVTSTMKFVVGELPEIVEQEIDGEPIPVPVTLPVTINGRIFPREDVDIWTLTAAAGESITCEVHAARLGYPLIARVEVLDPDGRRIAEGTHNVRADTRVQFRAIQPGTYQVRIHDVRYAGSQCHVYRLTITQQPCVDAIYPLGGRAGAVTPFQLLGQGVPTMPVDVMLDENILQTSTASAAWKRFPIADVLTNPVLVDVGRLPEYLEPDAPTSNVSSSVELPAVLNGRIRSPGESDAWSFAGKQGETWRLDLMAARLDSPLDSVLVVHDVGGRELLHADDIGPGETDSQAVFTVPADGVYTIRVADQFTSRGGERFAYRLFVTSPPTPDFQLQLGGDALAVNRGAEASFKVTAQRIGGFDGEIQLQCDGLPPGVAAAPAVIGRGSSDIDWTFRAGASAKVQLSHLRVRGQSRIGEQDVVRYAAFPTPRGEPPLDFVPLLVALPTPFKYAGRTSIEYVPCGSSLHWHFRLDRGGFEGPIDIELADRQFRHLMGLTAPRMTVPAGATEFDYPVSVAPWTLLGRTGRAVISASATLHEPDGTSHEVSFSTHNDDDQVVVLASPPLLTVDTPRKTIVARPGATISLPLRISRNARLNAATVKVELVPARHVRGISARPCQVPPATTDCVLEIRFDDSELGPWNAPLIVRATSDFDGDPIIAEMLLFVSAG